MRKPINRFDVQVAFEDFAFGIKSRTDVTLTPDDVARALEGIIARIRNGGMLPDEAQDDSDDSLAAVPSKPSESSSITNLPADSQGRDLPDRREP